MRRTFKSALHSIVDYVFPWECIFCQTRCRPDDVQSRPVCCSCHDLLVPSLLSSCPRCGASVGPHTDTSQGCIHCRGRRLHFDSVTCLSMYDEALRKAVLQAKWSWSSSSISVLAQLMALARAEQLTRVEADLVVPIPQAWDRRLMRHYNPAEVIAHVLGRSLGVRVARNLLRRKRRVSLQKRVSLQRRFANQKDSFRVRRAATAKGKRILLVDDVLTTGATCSEASHALKQAGAAACTVAVLGRVLGTR